VKVFKDYLGRDVRLSDERLEHILEHPEMRGLEGEFEEAVSKPELVIESLSDETVLLYYRILHETRVGAKWCCMVVKYKVDDAFILTAYLTDKPKKGVQRWPLK
jgi:hypothetical protein